MGFEKNRLQNQNGKFDSNRRSGPDRARIRSGRDDAGRSRDSGIPILIPSWKTESAEIWKLEKPEATKSRLFCYKCGKSKFNENYTLLLDY